MDLKDNFPVKFFKWFFSVKVEKPKNSENLKLIFLDPNEIPKDRLDNFKLNQTVLTVLFF